MFGKLPPLMPGATIVGQPFTVHNWFPVVAVTHNCENKGILALGAGAPQQCPGCGRMILLAGLQISPPAAPGQPPQLGFNLQVLPTREEQQLGEPSGFTN